MFRVTLILLLCMMSVPASASVRIKDITTLQGVRENQIVGYGLVVGLQGTGDTLTNSIFTAQSLQSMLDRMGVNIRGAPRGQILRTRNIAAVLVTGDLPPFGQPGSRIDVTVSSLGDATSLLGGTLILTSLSGIDGQTYAVAQGQVAVAGFAVSGQAESITQNVATAGRIPGGAVIEREAPGQLRDIGPLMLVLNNPDFSTSVRIADAINAFAARRYKMRVAHEQDQRSVILTRPPRAETARFVAEIGQLYVEPDTPARVVMDSRSGTVVIGQDVQISTVAVTQGNLTVQISELPVVSQPAPFSRGRTVVVPNTEIEATQDPGPISIVRGTTLRSLVNGLNKIGLTPSGIIAILQAIKSAGALHAELVVQ
ncbi:MAG: flagellar basal body P-ring protein FlgI [Beijerinckiaceae bacterium]|nr:flagellar basal body P-ring protein FlgI [Beijerinckiaceae bacterium]MCI0734832.1 flagellar basal body P-ring protein FlgI [Beijerinckiaceae bacterium]